MTQAPLATALGCISIALVAGVLAVGHGGKLTLVQMLGLGAAALFALAATAQAARSSRVRAEVDRTRARSSRSTAVTRSKS